jgi:NAD(P)-dependent dehydrogenase (short-subunit alcohol dehydrogenase family)
MVVRLVASDHPHRSVKDRFDLTGRVAFITGGGGLLGPMHAEAIAELGGIAVLADINLDRAKAAASEISKSSGTRVLAESVDITSVADVERAVSKVEKEIGPIGILINNAANDPKVGAEGIENPTRVETFPIGVWSADLAVGLTGTFLCCQVIGSRMAKRRAGVILNISSDLGIVAPDQRLYERPDTARENQPVKPITYSVVKHGVIGITKYLATYWATEGVRVNALAPGGVLAGQSPDFLEKVNSRIPLGRLALRDEYKGAVAFLCSDASSYMTGAVLVADGGRTVW